MSYIKAKSIYGIRHKESGDFVQFNSKTCWKTAGAAKLSFYACQRYSKNIITFDEQDQYEIVELLEPYYRLEGLEK